VNAAEGQKRELPIGGPEIYTHRQIAKLAFLVPGKPLRITSVPLWMVNPAVKVIRPFSEHYYTLASFFAAVMQNDFEAPKAGTHSLRKYYQALYQNRVGLMPQSAPIMLTKVEFPALVSKRGHALNGSNRS